MSEENIKQNSPKAWLLAARPKTLTGCAVPVMIGLALAYTDDQVYYDGYAFSWLAAVLPRPEYIPGDMQGRALKRREAPPFHHRKERDVRLRRIRRRPPFGPSENLYAPDVRQIHHRTQTALHVTADRKSVV